MRAAQVPAGNAPQLLTREARNVEKDGSYLHWPGLDLHLDLQGIREMTDEAFKEQAKLEQMLSDKAFGKAIAALRKKCRLTQSDIADLSERQVRRIEQGAGTRISSLACFAQAHKMELNAYLHELAMIMQTMKQQLSGTKN